MKSFPLNFALKMEREGGWVRQRAVLKTYHRIGQTKHYIFSKSENDGSLCAILTSFPSFNIITARPGKSLSFSSESSMAILIELDKNPTSHRSGLSLIQNGMD